MCAAIVQQEPQTEKGAHWLLNVDATGGYRAVYVDTGEVYDSHICYIDGIECYADEVKFGGIVIEVKR